MMKANFTGVKMSDGSSLLPAGIYHLEITKTEDTTSSSNNDMVVITFKAENEEHSGRLTHFLAITEKSLPMVKKFLYCINQPHEGNDVVIESRDWLGATLDAEIFVDTYTRKDGTSAESNKVKYFVKTMTDLPKNPDFTVSNSNEDIPF